MVSERTTFTLPENLPEHIFNRNIYLIYPDLNSKQLWSAKIADLVPTEHGKKFLIQISEENPCEKTSS